MIYISWDVMLRHWASGSRCFDGTQCLHLQVSSNQRTNANIGYVKVIYRQAVTGLWLAGEVAEPIRDMRKGPGVQMCI
jgi:hypothetical protein